MMSWAPSTIQSVQGWRKGPEKCVPAISNCYISFLPVLPLSSYAFPSLLSLPFPTHKRNFRDTNRDERVNFIDFEKRIFFCAPHPSVHIIIRKKELIIEFGLPSLSKNKNKKSEVKYTILFKLFFFPKSI